MSKDSSAVYKVKVNEFEFLFTQQQFDAVDLIRTSPTAFNLLNNHRSVNAVLIEADESAKKQTIEIGGERFAVQIRDELDITLDKMGFGMVTGKQIKEIKAPMPGLVLEVTVTEGQHVYEGDRLLILVAMKMENSILINTEATIKRIAVGAGETVDRGQVLIELV